MHANFTRGNPQEFQHQISSHSETEQKTRASTSSGKNNGKKRVKCNILLLPPQGFGLSAGFWPRGQNPRRHYRNPRVIAPAGFWPRGQNPRRHYRNPRVIENMYAITRKNLESLEQRPQRICG